MVKTYNVAGGIKRVDPRHELYKGEKVYLYRAVSIPQPEGQGRFRGMELGHDTRGRLGRYQQRLGIRVCRRRRALLARSSSATVYGPPRRRRNGLSVAQRRPVQHLLQSRPLRLSPALISAYRKSARASTLINDLFDYDSDLAHRQPNILAHGYAAGRRDIDAWQDTVTEVYFDALEKGHGCLTGDWPVWADRIPDLSVDGVDHGFMCAAFAALAQPSAAREMP
ncbi:uncharacterized protein MAM_01771 [Metarhizium album ARSEF 1941]|uniref:Uncharacterized protein n=1 Tax=Metarhizium album (strain ARSEF 1941) TaxID=1081103 RepID=A0A0B2X5F3_METAS|nr:uncharacterized protein MAM_01771 [Metarhizium album ARSEF 1941]KHO00993.1 hypothetical protein MAM_01771 [Metarhizium album ARSEF 1941]